MSDALWSTIYASVDGKPQAAAAELIRDWNRLKPDQRSSLAKIAGLDYKAWNVTDDMGLEDFARYAEYLPEDAPERESITYGKVNGQYMVDTTNDNPKKAAAYLESGYDDMDFYTRMRLFINAGYDDDTARELASDDANPYAVAEAIYRKSK